MIAYDRNNEEGILFKIDYASEIIEEEKIEKILDIVKYLLEQIVEDASKEVGRLEYLTKEEYNKVAIKWNETEKEYPSDKTVNELFEEQVEKSPDSIAVIYKNKQLTYRLVV